MKATLVAKVFPFPTHLRLWFFSTCHLLQPYDYLLLRWGYSSCWVLEMDDIFSFSQNAALKLFTNAKTSGVCKVRFGSPGIALPQGPTGQHVPQLARSAEPSREKKAKSWYSVLAPVSSGGLRASLKIHSSSEGLKRIEKEFGHLWAACRRGPVEMQTPVDPNFCSAFSRWL